MSSRTVISFAACAAVVGLFLQVGCKEHQPQAAADGGKSQHDRKGDIISAATGDAAITVSAIEVNGAAIAAEPITLNPEQSATIVIRGRCGLRADRAHAGLHIGGSLYSLSKNSVVMTMGEMQLERDGATFRIVGKAKQFRCDDLTGPFELVVTDAFGRDWLRKEVRLQRP